MSDDTNMTYAPEAAQATPPQAAPRRSGGASKTLVIILVAAVALAVGFGGGYLVATKTADTPGGIVTAGDGRGARGAFMQLTEEERQKLQSMSAEERQQFFKDKGIELPEGFDPSQMPGGPDSTRGSQGGMRFGGTDLIQGKVVSSSADKVTVQLDNGGSATLYVDDSTVVGAVSGKTAELKPEASIVAVAQPEAQGVTAAKLIVVK